MKPNFALNLSHSGIVLLHRAKTGWLRVGEVNLDAPDLDVQLNLLRTTATDLETGGLTTKLVIPNSQILYTEVAAPGPDTAARISQIRDGLAGLTPYDVSDLVFDWRMVGGRAQVAVVARDTLREAEAFAMRYRFNPVSYVAAPVNGVFPGEPFFGPTRHASTLLTDGEMIEPDDEQIAVIGQVGGSAKPAKPEAAKPPKKKPQTEADAAAETAVPAPADPAPVAEPEPVLEPDPEVAIPSVTFTSRRKQLAAPPARPDAAPEQEPAARDAGRAPARPGAVTATTLDLDPPERADGPGRGRFDPDAPTEARDKARAALYAKPAAEAPGPTPGRKTPMPVTAPHTADVADPKDKLAERRKQARQKARDPGPARADMEIAARRALTGASAANAAAAEAEALTVFGARGREQPRGRPRYLGLVLTMALLLALAVMALWSTYFMNGLSSGLFGTIDEEPEFTAPAVIPQPEPVDPALPERDIAALPAEPEPAAPSDAPEAGVAPGATDAAVEAALAEPEPVEDPAPEPVEAPAIADPQPDPAAAPETEIAAPETEIAPAPDEAAPETEIAAPAPEADIAQEADVAAIDPEAEPAAEPPVEIAALPAPDPAAAPAAEPPPPIVPEPIVSVPERQPPPTPAEAEARYAATGIWQLDPEPLGDVPGGGDPLEDVYIASIDPDVGVGDAVALPGAAALDTDRRPPALNPPAPLGTSFDFDGRGLIRATPDGAMTPDGVPVYSGAPSVVPGPRPGDLDVPEDDTRLQRDDRLRTLRPVPRPGGLSEANERARLGGLSSVELAAIRPSARPLELERRASVLEPQPDAPQPDAPQEEDTRTAAVDPVFIGNDATALAVAASRAPPVRPSNFASVIEQALREATRAPPAPLPEEAEEDEPEVVVAAAPRMPPVPSRASVAKQATVRNAINLGKVNLIGVYGSPSKRRALVRLGNGKYVKVEVGDRVDGGRVAAIGSNELRYVKRGRNITLKMPKG